MLLVSFWFCQNYINFGRVFFCFDIKHQICYVLSWNIKAVIQHSIDIGKHSFWTNRTTWQKCKNSSQLTRRCVFQLTRQEIITDHPEIKPQSHQIDWHGTYRWLKWHSTSEAFPLEFTQFPNRTHIFYIIGKSTFFGYLFIHLILDNQLFLFLFFKFLQCKKNVKILFRRRYLMTIDGQGFLPFMSWNSVCPRTEKKIIQFEGNKNIRKKGLNAEKITWKKHW